MSSFFAEIDTTQALVGGVCLLIPALVLYFGRSSSHKSPADPRIPHAPGALPAIGHAAEYRKDPPAFLKKAQAATKSHIFRINLAGRKMILIGADIDLEWQIARQPESIFSSRQAVAKVGFDETLGKRNVFVGTDFHKKLLKNTIYKDWNAFTTITTKRMRLALETLLQEYTTAENGTMVQVPDLFQLCRKTILHTVLSVFMGTCLVKDNSLIEDFMRLQDKIEDATAAAAVLPRWLANPLALSPTKQMRLNIQEKVATAIAEAKQQSNYVTAMERDAPFYGPWLKAMDEDGMKPLEMAELIVGFVFAAHKNPAIGGAQSCCHMWEHVGLAEPSKMASTATHQDVSKNAELWKAICEETKRITADTSLTWDQLENMAPTLEACVAETTRISAHSIGSIREVMTETTLTDGEGNAFTVYPGETLAASHYLYNTDAHLFPRREENYSPEVHLQLAKDKNASSDAIVHRTFSAGVHKCAGEKISYILMRYFVALMVERQARCTKAIPPVSFERATLAQRDGPVPIELMLRLP